MPEGKSAARKSSRSSNQIASSIKRDRRGRSFAVPKCCFGCSGVLPNKVNKVSSPAGKLQWTKTQRQSPSAARDGSGKCKLPSNPGGGEGASVAAGNRLVAFSFDEIRKVAGDFLWDALICRDDSGRVYRGSFYPPSPAGMPGPAALPVAVKVQHEDNSFWCHHHDWLAEVFFLGQLSHPNLVKLIGYCCEGKHRVLVSEYMAMGSVESHLFSRMLPPLTWVARMKIALGVARGLAFLHGAKPRPIFYRDFKTSSIILDAGFNAKLSCSGLVNNGPVRDTASSNVYSYGVVLLELLTGEEPALNRPRPLGEQALVEWALPALQHKKRVLDIVDPRLLADGGAPPASAVHMVAMLAYRCLSRDPGARPLMCDVVACLEPLQQPAEEPPRESSLNYSRQTHTTSELPMHALFSS